MEKAAVDSTRFSLDNYIKNVTDNLKRKHVIKKHDVCHLEDTTVEFNSRELAYQAVVHISDSKNCKFIFPADSQVVKLTVEGCKDCSIYLKSRLITGVVEIWNCVNQTINVYIPLGTLQVDLCQNSTAFYQNRNFLGSVVQAGMTKGFHLKFGDGMQDVESGFEVLKTHYTSINATSDQFITRWVKGSLLTEQLIRLSNEFPTTKREQTEFEGNLPTNQHYDMTDPKNKLLRARFKRVAGNDAYKAKNFQHAAVLYTAAIILTPENHLLYCNRAACFLKLGEYEKALADAEMCIELEPTFAKGHFRLGLALLAMGTYPQAIEALEGANALLPNNAHIQASLAIAQKKAAEQPRTSSITNTKTQVQSGDNLPIDLKEMNNPTRQFDKKQTSPAKYDNDSENTLNLSQQD